MGWDEWEQLKTEAAARHATGTRLDSASGGGGNAGLRTSKAAWTKAGEGLGSLTTAIDKAQRQLEDGQEGLGKDTGCETAGAQRETHTSWKEYAAKVQKRCDDLREVLERSGHDLSKTDAAVEADLDKVASRYKDTLATGGSR